jgi:hypothetical protein
MLVLVACGTELGAILAYVALRTNRWLFALLPGTFSNSCASLTLNIRLVASGAACCADPEASREEAESDLWRRVLSALAQQLVRQLQLQLLASKQQAQQSYG